MKKLNDYQQFFAIKRALKTGRDLSRFGRRVAQVDLKSIHTLAGTSYLSIRHEGDLEHIFADIQEIKIIEKS